MAGRRPKPTHLKLVQGNPGKRAINRSEPKPRRVLPSPPAHLRARAKVAWGYVSAQLDNMGVLTEADALALERLCECYADLLDAQASLDKAVIVPNADGDPFVLAKAGESTYATRGKEGWMLRTRPEVAQIADADRRFKSYLVEFGLTPAARSKVKGDGSSKEADPAAEFFGS